MKFFVDSNLITFWSRYEGYVMVGEPDENLEAEHEGWQQEVHALKRLLDFHGFAGFRFAISPTILDVAFLRALGFTEDVPKMCEELQDRTCRMVWRRMAKTENSREARMMYDEWVATGQPFSLDLREADEDVD